MSKLFASKTEGLFFEWLSKKAGDIEDGETGTAKCFEIACEVAELPEEITEWAAEIAMTQSALNAGIPLSVIQGKTKLKDHFSQEYIDHMRNKSNDEDNVA